MRMNFNQLVELSLFLLSHSEQINFSSNTFENSTYLVNFFYLSKLSNKLKVYKYVNSGQGTSWQTTLVWSKLCSEGI